MSGERGRPVKAEKLVIEAVRSLKAEKGFTPKEVLNYIASNHGPKATNERCVLAALKRGANFGLLRMQRGRFALKLVASKRGMEEPELKGKGLCKPRKSRRSRSKGRKCSCRKKSRRASRRRSKSRRGCRRGCTKMWTGLKRSRKSRSRKSRRRAGKSKRRSSRRRSRGGKRCSCAKKRSRRSRSRRVKRGGKKCRPSGGRSRRRSHARRARSARRSKCRC